MKDVAKLFCKLTVTHRRWLTFYLIQVEDDRILNIEKNHLIR